MLDPTLAVRLIIGLYRGGRRRIQLRGSADWPMADGRITNSHVKRDDLRGWVVELTYSYVAMGEYYAGVFQRAFTRKKHAESFLKRFPKAIHIPVRYKFERPETSTLLLSDLTLQLAGL
jgi:Protein of unknown function (DUF3592)